MDSLKKKRGVQTWQSEWDASNKSELTKTFFPIVKERISKRLQMCINFSMIITGHGKLRTYFHRFKMIDGSGGCGGSTWCCVIS